MSAPNQPKSVAMIIKQGPTSRSSGSSNSSTTTPKPGGSRTSSGGGGVSNSGNVDNLNPVLPPLYPPAPRPTVIPDPDTEACAKVYSQLGQYFKSNFSVDHKSNNASGFVVERYTDQYKSPLALKPHLIYKLPDSCFPEELTNPNFFRNKPVEVTLKKLKREVGELPDDDREDEGEGDKGGPLLDPKKGKEEDNDEEEAKDKANPDDDIDENDEDMMDEEMDAGTDYALSYFDNGEGDDDDRADEDGPTY